MEINQKLNDIYVVIGCSTPTKPYTIIRGGDISLCLVTFYCDQQRYVLAKFYCNHVESITISIPVYVGNVKKRSEFFLLYPSIVLQVLLDEIIKNVDGHDLIIYKNFGIDTGKLTTRIFFELL
jgi:hypothetical protein